MLNRLRVGWVVGLCLLAAVGCGSDDGIGRRYPLSGRVTYNGQPVKDATINFVADPAGPPNATATVKDGRYASVTTLSPGDGLLPGKYKVAINAVQGIDAKDEQNPGGAPDQVTIAKAQANAKSALPDKYANAFDSGLTLDMTSSTTTKDFELKD